MNDKLDYKLFAFIFLMTLYKFCEIAIGNLHLLLFYLPGIIPPESQSQYNLQIERYTTHPRENSVGCFQDISRKLKSSKSTEENETKQAKRAPPNYRNG